ncbi:MULTISPECIES: glycosyltransferase [unclassified Crossiella]|uniref:glycosyltransferase n=1 Tax=unclassified Crossiella TaxID=2620835 RepID=UPI001FFF9B64|nr:MULTISPECIES: glycosyltransferase [unclassified Crossiella]MCK2244256.1 glycosyltransferase [Crossiella sp. S99.2]MCK2258060.1 glycosyltransferase [Crossiella sp. S99.1]
MRVLFSSLPAFGHLVPLLPFAVAARSAGAEVAVATAASKAHVVGDLPFIPVGADWPELAAEHERRGWSIDMTDISDPAGVIALCADTRVDLCFEEVLAVAKEFQPDLIISDVADLIAPLVATVLDVPWAFFNITTTMPPEMHEGFAERFAFQAESRGLTPSPPLALLDAVPSLLHLAGHLLAENRIPMRPRAHRPPGAESAVLERGDRRRVLLTLGTVVDPEAHLARLLAAVSTVDAEILVTAEEAPDAPENVRFVGFTSLADLLPSVDAVVTVGGAGTVSATLSHGLPMVIQPVLADQPFVAQGAAGTGAAIVLGPDETDRIAEAVGTVLTDPAYRDAAREAAVRIAELPAPQDAWAELLRRLP